MIKIVKRIAESTSELTGKKGEGIVIQHSHAEQGQVVTITELPQILRLLLPIANVTPDSRKPTSKRTADESAVSSS